MAAALLTPEPLTLTNVPRLADVRAMADLLRSFGVDVEVTRNASLTGGDTIRLHAADITSSFASYDMVRKMRASFQVLAPLLARHGEAKVSLPGGCAIGARPVNLHLDALARMGAKVELSDGYVIASAKGGLKGAAIQCVLCRRMLTVPSAAPRFLCDGCKRQRENTTVPAPPPRRRRR